MERLGHLSLLWASISAASCSWLAPAAGSQPTQVMSTLHAPKLSLLPPSDIFTRGEKVRLTCSPPDLQRAAKFLFYKMNPDGRWGLMRRQKKNTWEVSTAHLEPQNTFACSYEGRNRAGEPLQSAQSNPRMVSLIELPSATLSLDPKYPVYLQGERVTLTCSAPERLQVAGYIFYKEQQDQTLTELPHKGQGPYEVLKVDRSTAGKYSCVYWTLLSGQEIRSPHSSLVSVAVTELPRSPVFSVSPKREVYRSGEFINLTCSAPDSRPVSKMTFLKDSRQLLATQLPFSLDSFTYTLPLLPQDGGQYFCKYQVVESGREIPSPTSNNIRISVSAVPPTVTVPESPTAVQATPSFATKTTVADSPRAPTTSAPQPASAQPATEENPLSSAEPDRPATSTVTSSQPTSHDRVPSVFPSQNSTKPFSKSGDLTSASQATAASKAEHGNVTLTAGGALLLPLVAGCSGAGVPFLVFLVFLVRKKSKGNSRRLSRRFWTSLKSHEFRRVSRINHPNSGAHLEVQEKAQPQQVSQDWGILPKSKPGPSKRGDPAVSQNQADDDVDSGAEFEFPDIDPTYTLLGYPCSTFFLEEGNPPANDTHIYQEAL